MCFPDSKSITAFVLRFFFDDENDSKRLFERKQNGEEDDDEEEEEEEARVSFLVARLFSLARAKKKLFCGLLC